MTLENEQKNKAQTGEASSTSTATSFRNESYQGIVLKDRYVLDKELGRGGIGIVYLAHDLQLLSTPVVVKILKEEMSIDDYVKKKFRHEMEALSRIDHPSVVKVLDIGDLPDGNSYLVMQYVEGVSLRAVMRSEGMDLDRVAHLVRQIGMGLSAAHEKGVYHRDLKPENIMVQNLGGIEELVKLIDFGIAKVTNSEFGSTTKWGVTAGTVEYMAPERLGANQTAPREQVYGLSDIYSFGLIAYEMVTGRRPFVIDAFGPQKVIQLLALQQEGVKAKPRDLRSSLPKSAQEVILKALSFDPTHRYRRARDFGEDLERALLDDAGTPEDTSPTSAAGPHSELSETLPYVPPPMRETTLPGANATPSEATQPSTLAVAHVLFMDVIGYSQLTTGQQPKLLHQLQEVVRNTDEFRRALKGNQLISLPTGDGMALVFFGDPTAPIRCAMEISRALRGSEIKLRIGVHSGPVYQIKDINANNNVAGGGINIAQRVMDCGDAGHILVSKTVAEVLIQLGDWDGCLHDLGEKEVKHGVRVHLFNFCFGESGNPDLPEKLRPGRATRDEQSYSHYSPVIENSILTQILGVSHHRDISGKEGLVYASVPLGEVSQEPILVRVKGSTLQKYIEDVRIRVDDLTKRALVGQKREDSGIETAASALARHVLPPSGFIGMMGAGVHPQFDIIQDAAAEIPWEVLDEIYFFCPKCRRATSPLQQTPVDESFCEKCGGRMEVTGGKLALTYHLTHLVRGQGRLGGEGRQFLFIEDPGEDLCSPEKDPDGICAKHLRELHSLIEQQGYRINLLQRKNATVRHVLQAIADPSLVGVYYFGHGFLPRGGDEGCLLLADGQLFAGQIEEAAPAGRFVFLNACEGASAGRDWDLEKRTRTVANAFAKGGRGKVVIAPLWPVVNIQAAETALDFFRHASHSSPLGEAMKRARAKSLQRYEAGEPHLSWMAYRFFGDPNKTLPLPMEVPVEVSPDVEVRPASRVFDGSGRLNTEIFSFAVDEVLLRAAKRRNQHGREQVTITDFLAGLIRKGDLTRYLLRRGGQDPDELYKTIIGSVEKSDRTAGSKTKSQQDHTSAANSEDPAMVHVNTEISAEAELKEILARLIVRRKEEFDDSLIKLLEKVDLEAQKLGDWAEGRRISEKGTLEGLLTEEKWEKLTADGFINTGEFQRLLRESEQSREVDEDGSLFLSFLGDAAKRVIETAHVLAQQRGVFPISHRLLFAAFLNEEESFAARACRRTGVRPELLFVLMIAATESDSLGNCSPRSYGLSYEACERIITPVLEEARNRARNKSAVTEEDLFRAFCVQADIPFKEWLKEPPLAIDLDELLVPLSPINDLDPAAREIVQTAHSLSQRCGVFPITNRLTLAAFLRDHKGHAARLFRQQNVPVELLCDQLISESVRGAERQFPLTVEACEKAITPMLRRAQETSGGGELITEQLLFRSFCEVVTPALKMALKSPPWGIDLDAVSLENVRAHSSWSEGPKQPSAENAELAQFNRDQFEFDSWNVLITASQLSLLDGWAEIKSPHLFAAIIGDGLGPGADAMRRLNAHPEEFKRIVLTMVPPRSQVSSGKSSMRFSENAQRIVETAVRAAQSGGRIRATVEDLWSSFFADGGGIIGDLFVNSGLELPARSGEKESMGKDSRERSSVLSELGADLTEKAMHGQLPKVIGRDKEIETAIQTLLLSENANPLLIGEAGVGKTAIVEGIAQRIANGHCPRNLQSVRIIELSAGGLVANTRLRGEFEQRIQLLLAEARGNVILFIDEIHTIIGAGAAEGGGPDAGNMLKAALARGELRLIGATTHGEYRRTIERDKALSRRFQMQIIGPPTRESTIHILTARQAALEQHHGVRITKGSKLASVDLSGRYITDRHWPAKARDVLERACVIAVTERKGRQQTSAAVKQEHVAKAVSRLTGVPLERVSASDLSSLKTLEERVSKRITGQLPAVRIVADAIRRGRQGLADANKPWGVFLFAGPPGVGKTELAKVLAEEVYGGSDGLIRFDMGDFTEPHSVAKLTGAPPGYVGYHDGAPLVEHLHKHPYSLLLFDEIEHAHENVLAVLLRFLSEGILVDSAGGMADARNSIIVMTTNILDSEREVTRVGFTREPKETSPSPDQSVLRSMLERHFPAKLIDRLDAILQFSPLTEDDLSVIAERKIKEMVDRATTRNGILVAVNPEVLAWVANKAANESCGARHIQRSVDEHVGAPLSVALSNLRGAPKKHLQLALRADKSRIECIWSDGKGKDM